jgi:LPXTG-site transpeptidase (sortase) family protein
MPRSIRPVAILLIPLLLFIVVPVLPAFADTTYDAQVHLSFTPAAIGLNETSRLAITVANGNALEINDVAWSDALPTGLLVSAIPNLASDCGGLAAISNDRITLSLVHGYIAANGTCTVSVDVRPTAAGTLDNTIPVGTLTATASGGTVGNSLLATASLSASTLEYSASALASFSPDYINLGDPTQLFIDISNPNTFALTGAALQAVSLPSGLVFSAAPNPSSSCGGTLAADTGLNQLSFSGGTVPASSAGVNGSCRLSVSVTSNLTSNIPFILPAGSINANGSPGTGNVGNLFPATATLHSGTISAPVQINKQFSPSSIYPGDITRLSVTIYNPNTFPLTNAAWTDNLVGVQPGLRIADTPGVTNDPLNGGCGGTVTADPGGTNLALSGGTVPAKNVITDAVGQCTISVNITATTQGNLTNTIQTGTFSADPVSGQVISNTDPASHTVKVNTLLPPSLTKSFTPNTVWVEGSSQMSIHITNTDAHAITQVGLTDVLPGSVVVASPANPSISASCGSASLAANPGSGLVLIENAAIAGGATCTISVDVKSSTPGEYVNRIEAGALRTHEGVTNASYAAGQLNVQATELSKQFSPTSFEAGETSTLTITLENRDLSQAYTNVGLVDILPAPLFAQSASTTCGGSVALSSTGSPARVSTITLSGGTLPQATTGTPIQTCTITAVVSTLPGAVRTSTTVTNTLAAKKLTTAQGVTNLTAATANVTVTPITVSVGKGFSVSPIQAGGDSVLTITLSNQTTKDLTNVSLLDSMPAGLLLNDAYTPTSSCANGSAAIVEANPPTTTTRGLQLTITAMPNHSSCSFTAHVTTATDAAAQTLNNVIGAQTLDSDQGVTNLSGISKSITIYKTGTGLTGDKSFSPATVMAGATTRFTVHIYAPPDHSISGLSVSDHLPAGMSFTSSPSPSATCGAGAAASASGTTLTLTGGSMAASGTCTISVNVKADGPGTFTNSVAPADVTSTEGQTLAASFSGSVRVTNMKVSKAFYPDTIAPDGLSTLTITLTNTNTTRVVGVNLTDTFPAGDATNGSFQVAAVPNIRTTCGSTDIITAVPDAKQISMAGGEIPGQVGSVPGICTISVDVQGKRTATVPAVGTLTNTIPIANVTGTLYNSSPTVTLQPDAPTSDDLNITGLTLGVVKTVDPLTVFGGTSSTLSLTIVNENNVLLTGIRFDDVMPAGMYIANPANFSTGTCGGSLTGTVGASTFFFRDGQLAAQKRCTLSLSISMNKNGNLTNTIGARAITSFNGAFNTQAASATLTNLPGASISKFFTPASMVLGNTSTLTITITNTGNVPLDGMGFTDTLPGTLPGGLYIAAGSQTNTCGGTLTASAASQSIQLSGGSIAAGPGTTCSITLPVTSTRPGVYKNTIAPRSLTTNQKATNSDPAEDTLKIVAAPDLQLVKTGVLDVSGGTSSTTADAGDLIHYTLVATNLGDVTLSNVTISDTKLASLVCTPDQPAQLKTGETLTCSGDYTLVASDITAGRVINTAQVTSKLPDGVTDGPTANDSANIPLNQQYALGLKKAVSNTGPYRLGSLITYTITATNLGLDPLTNVTISDSAAVLGTCTPAQGATLNRGDPMVCQASHTVVVADVDLGNFSNTATVTGYTGDPDPIAKTASDTAAVPIKQNASIELFKQVLTDGPYTQGTVVQYEISAVNNGEQTLNSVTITDAGVTFSPACSPVTLQPGAALTCTASHTLSATDMSNGGYRNTASVTSTLPGSGLPGPTATATRTIITNQPAISLSKVGTLNDANKNGLPDAGEAIQYVFTITNSGPVTLTNVTLADVIGGVTITGSPIASLAHGDVDTTSYTGAYTLKQSDINSGTFTNTAIVTGTPPVGSPVSASASDLQSTLSQPSISVTKTGVLDMTAAGQSGRVDSGDKITYTFTVKNTGNVALSNVALSDSKFTVTGSAIGSLAIGATATLTSTYTLSQADVDAGSYQNKATVTGTPPTGANVSATSTATVTLTADPQVTLQKTGTFNDVNSNGRADAGDTVSYAFTVANPGNVTLTDVLVTDPLVTVQGTAITLAPWASDTSHFTGTYTLKQSDLDAGTFTNTATVTGTKPLGGTITAQDGDTQTLTRQPSILLEKTGVQNKGSNSRIDAGETITYSFKVTNTGNVTLTNVTVTDSMVTVTGSPIASLAPGASNAVTLTANHTVTQAEIDSGSLYNSASVSGTPPAGLDVTSTSNNTQTLVPVGAMTLAKTATLHNDVAGLATVTDPGDTITYAFTVTNTGNVTLSNITLADLKVSMTGGAKIDSLAPGASDSTTFTATHTLTQAEIDARTYANTATASGKTPAAADVSANGSASVSGLATPSIDLVKTATLNDENANLRVDAGETIHYAFTVTNTGNVALSNVTVTDSNGTTVLHGSPIALLAIGASDATTYTADHTITQAEINAGYYTNSATATGTPPIDSNVTDTASVKTDLAQVPHLTLVKTGTFVNVVGTARPDAGDKITYAFSITNDGNVTLTSVNVTDAVGGVTITGSPIASLAPGQSNTTAYTGTYTLKQADLNAGSFTNTATVTGTKPLGGTTTAQDSETMTLPADPSVTLVKTGVQNMGGNARIDVGETITYSFKVTNTGNVTLSAVTVSDSRLTVTGSPIASLAPGAGNARTLTATYTVTQADIDNGSLYNSASVSGTPPGGGSTTAADDDTQTLVPVGTMTLVKTATLHNDIVGSATVTDPGDTITYTFIVTNTGNVTLSGVSLSDPGTVMSGGPVASLLPGAANRDTSTFTASHVLTQAEINAGFYNNTATASGQTPKSVIVSAIGSASVTSLNTPSIGLTKSGVLNDPNTNGRADAGETITYSFVVTNTGNVALNPVSLTDADPNTTVSGGPISLAIGGSDSSTFTGTHTISQAEIDAGSFTNSATVSGKPPTGSNVTATATFKQTLTAAPGISLVKTGTLHDGGDGKADVGDTITYTFAVTNTGNVTLTNVSVADKVGGVTVSGTPIASLAPGAANSTAYTGTYTIQQADIDLGRFDNTATATGTRPVGGAISADGSTSVALDAHPAISIVKTGVLDTSVVAPAGLPNPGDVINYTLKVTNTGNVSLHAVAVNDAKISITGSAIGNLQPGAANAVTLTGSYTLTQADVNAGTFTNTALASGKTPTDFVVNSSDGDTQSLTAAPSMTLAKTGTLDKGTDGVATPGDLISYTFTITNTGNVTLYGITLADTAASLSGGPSIASLAPGASSTAFTGTYALKQSDLDAGTFTNTATASGNPPSGSPVTASDGDTQSGLSSPAITLLKTGTVNLGSNARADAGDTITYHFTVTNTGNVALSNVTVSDPLVTVSGGPISLAIGGSDSTSFSGTYTLTQADIDAGSRANTATVSGKPPTGSNMSAQSTETKTLAADARITLLKTGTLDKTVVAPGSRADAGDTISYTFTVSNPGNVPLTGVLVTDPKATITGTAITLAPGQTNTTQFTGTYTLTQADIDAGTFSNTASVSGTPPVGAAVSNTSTDTKNTLSAPAITLAKAGTLDLGTDGLLNAGDLVRYTFTIQNTGNVALGSVGLSDANASVTLSGNPIQTLGIGATDSSTFTGTYVLTQDDIDKGSFTNKATVTGTPPTGSPVSSDGSDTRTLAQVKSITLSEVATLNKNIVGLPDVVDAGDTVTYKFTITNTSNVRLTGVHITDPDVTILGGPIANMDPGAVDSTAITGTHTLAQADIDLGTFYHTATVIGTPPSGADVTATSSGAEYLADRPIIGVAKAVSKVERVSAGTYDVTFQVLARNYGNVTLHNVLLTDDLVAAFPLPTTFTVQSLSSTNPSLLLNVDAGGAPIYNGSTDLNLLKPGNGLNVGASFTLTLVVRVIPTSNGPYSNTVWATATGPDPNPDPLVDDGVVVHDESLAGANPDPDGDHNPNNNQGGTPIEFGATIFDPPYGIKGVDASGNGLLNWTMVWINDSNIVGVHAVVHDPIPEMTEFKPTLLASGYAVPFTAPLQSTSLGVSCTSSSGTTTDLCYYEGPTTAYPRGQIIWEGTLGPDLGVTDPLVAKNALSITFNVVVGNTTKVTNSAFIDSDLNGDGDVLDPGEQMTSRAERLWDVTPSGLPMTGFAPGRTSILPGRPALYTDLGDLWLEIPRLGVRIPIVGVPQSLNGWDVSWLGAQAGWLNGTAYPTQNGNSVITGHVYLPNGKPGPFVDLGKLAYNDSVVIHIGERAYAYQVRDVQRVNPDDLSVLQPKDRTWVTLLTCQGYDEKNGRYQFREVIRAVLVKFQ